MDLALLMYLRVRFKRARIFSTVLYRVNDVKGGNMDELLAIGWGIKREFMQKMDANDQLDDADKMFGLAVVKVGALLAGVGTVTLTKKVVRRCFAKKRR